jgi:tetratricopeptide (TPR) repeat protein
MAAGAAAHERSQGDKALMEGKLAVALKHFEKAVQMNGDDHLNWYKRATAYIIEKRYDAALKDLGKVIEMKADYAQAYDKRAKIFTSQGMCNKARIDQQKLQQLQALLAAGILLTCCTSC